jgi:hypothetical protein
VEAIQAHIAAEARLRAMAALAIARVWRDLPHHDQANVDEFVTKAALISLAAQRSSVAITEAFIGHLLRRPPLGVSPDELIGAAVRNGTAPEEVYKRPFVTLWSALGQHKPYAEGLAAGQDRAESAAAMDVQLAMRSTLRAVGEADKAILGYQRVPDANACPLCRIAATQRYRVRDLMPIHNRCGCSVDVITAANRRQFTGNPINDLRIEGDGMTVAVREHGELGPLLTNAADHFTRL